MWFRGYEPANEVLNGDNFIKVMKQYFSPALALFIMLYNGGVKSVRTIQMKATEQNFPVVLFIMLCKVVLTFESVDEILKCDRSNESY